jgi:hypothetical protein
MSRFVTFISLRSLTRFPGICSTFTQDLLSKMYIWLFEQKQQGDNITSDCSRWPSQSPGETANSFSSNLVCYCQNCWSKTTSYVSGSRSRLIPQVILEEFLETALVLLRIELADPDGELYPQVINSLNPESFEFFQKLPLELRVYIWRLTFPGRRTVSFDQECLGHNYPAFLKESSQQDPLPVTLYVNQEIRYETLRQYRVILRGSVFGYTPKEKPICFNPATDMAYITPFSLNPAKAPFSRWMAWLISQSPALLGEIKALEIRHMPWNLTVKTYLESPEKKLTAPMASILWFHALKKLYFTGSRKFPVRNLYMATLQTPEKIEDCKTTITNWLEVRKETFPGGKIPEVIVRPWQHICASRS